jgi:protein transport protein SEC13
MIWTQEDSTATEWSRKAMHKFPDVVWRLSWSVTGNILAASAGDNKVTLWHESPDGEWAQLSSMDENGAVTTST